MHGEIDSSVMHPHLYSKRERKMYVGGTVSHKRLLLCFGSLVWGQHPDLASVLTFRDKFYIVSQALKAHC